MLVMERGGPWGFLQADREGEGNAQDAQSKTGGAAPVRCASGVREGRNRASMDGSRRFSGRRERGGSSGDRRLGDPGARCEAWKDPALGHRGAGGRTAARQGAGRRAGAKAVRQPGANSSCAGKRIERSLPLRTETCDEGLTHSSAWKEGSANYAFTEFSEVAPAPC